MNKENRYKKWIIDNYPSPIKQKNNCQKAVRDMSFFFPELQINVGKANGIFHCWLRDKDGNIVDPTKDQFVEPVKYHFMADRFLDRDEVETSTGVVFLKEMHRGE